MKGLSIEDVAKGLLFVSVLIFLVAIFIVIKTIFLTFIPASSAKISDEIINPKIPIVLFGYASWYDFSLKNSPRYSETHYTAASRDFKRGTVLTVCSTEYYSWPPPCVDVKINDYGPQPRQTPERMIDLSSAAFKKLAPLKLGMLKVTVMLSSSSKQ